jgi:transposase
MRNSIGRAYFDKKITEAKTRNEVMRCPKRRLANHIWRMMIAEEHRLSATTARHEIAA